MKNFLTRLTLTVAPLVFIAFCLLGGADADTYNSASRDESVKQQEQAMRFNRAAIDQCGPGASYTLTDTDKEIQCVQRRTGKLTKGIEK